MGVRLAAIQASVATTWTYIESSAMAPTVATGIALAALYSLRALLQADDEQIYGWWRAATQLSDLSHPLRLDALGSSPLEKYQARLATLRDLPEVTALSSLDEIHTFIREAINTGAPRYNAGDVIGCCIAYWATMAALASAPVFRGFPGYAKMVAQLREVVEQPPPAAPFAGRGIDEFAWQLRHALDAILAIQG